MQVLSSNGWLGSSSPHPGDRPRRVRYRPLPARRGILAPTVALGVIKSPMNPAEAYGQLGALHPVGHMGEISDVVEAILYLESAGFVTGEILHVDGGRSAGH
jgi:NAD(P)-dependent dehydrogenase (short-subunit alcohol dehydrogenase family)